jgi:hypothetical protein
MFREWEPVLIGVACQNRIKVTINSTVNRSDDRWKVGEAFWVNIFRDNLNRCSVRFSVCCKKVATAVSSEILKCHPNLTEYESIGPSHRKRAKLKGISMKTSVWSFFWNRRVERHQSMQIHSQILHRNIYKSSNLPLFCHSKQALKPMQWIFVKTKDRTIHDFVCEPSLRFISFKSLAWPEESAELNVGDISAPVRNGFLPESTQILPFRSLLQAIKARAWGIY